MIIWNFLVLTTLYKLCCEADELSRKWMFLRVARFLVFKQHNHHFFDRFLVQKHIFLDFHKNDGNFTSSAVAKARAKITSTQKNLFRVSMWNCWITLSMFYGNIVLTLLVRSDKERWGEGVVHNSHKCSFWYTKIFS